MGIVEGENKNYCDEKRRDLVLLFVECNKSWKRTLMEYGKRYPGQRLPDRKTVERNYQRFYDTGKSNQFLPIIVVYTSELHSFLQESAHPWSKKNRAKGDGIEIQNITLF